MRPLFASFASLLALSVAACGASDGGTPTPAGSATFEESFDFDGFLLLAIPNGGGFNLVDPTTGLASALRYGDGYSEATLAISPDSRRLAYFTNDGLFVMEPELRDGRPELREVRSWPSAGSPPRVRFSPDGKHLLAGASRYDLETGETFSCGGGDDLGIFAAPGSDRVVCRDAWELYDGDELLMEIPFTRDFGTQNDGVFLGPSTDGQFYGLSTSVAAGVLRSGAAPPQGNADWNQWRHFNLPDGRRLVSDYGVHGKHVTSYTQHGVTTYAIETSEQTPTRTKTYDPFDLFEVRDYATEDAPWQLSVFSQLTHGEGRSWGFLGALPDSRRCR